MLFWGCREKYLVVLRKYFSPAASDRVQGLARIFALINFLALARWTYTWDSSTSSKTMSPKQSAAHGRSRSATSKTSSATNRKGAATGPSNTTAATRRKDKPAQSRGKQQRRAQQGDDDDNANPEVVDLGDDDDAELAGDMEVEEEDGDEGEEDEEERQTIPPGLLTRILHEFFEREETRITRDANAAVASYVDVFVREAIARAAVERGREGGFLEVGVVSFPPFPSLLGPLSG